jgi:uncharacterized membrane protein
MVCAAVIVYLVIAILGLLGMISKGGSKGSIVGSVIFIVVWAALISAVCRGGGSMIAWILVILPIVFPLFMVSHIK